MNLPLPSPSLVRYHHHTRAEFARILATMGEMWTNPYHADHGPWDAEFQAEWAVEHEWRAPAFYYREPGED